MDYTIVSTLRQLCIKHEWFTEGTNTQYERMFELAKDVVKNAADPALAVTRITDAIWMCSCNPETEGDADYNFIYQEIENWYRQMKEKESAFNV